MPAATATPTPNCVLGALDDLAAQMRADAAAITDLRGELRMLLAAIRLARPDIDAGRPPGKVAMLTALVDLLERRIDAMVENKAAAQATVDDNIEEAARPQLAVVPPPEEPELPIPSPFIAQPPAIAVVPDEAQPQTRRQRRDHAGGQRVGRRAARRQSGEAKPAAQTRHTENRDAAGRPAAAARGHHGVERGRAHRAV